MLGNQEQDLKLYQEILMKINEIIQADQLTVGDRLPSERELAERLSVGRSSVREALRALELLGLISTKRGEGTFIENYASHRLVEILAFYILRESKSKKDLLEIRTLIELDVIRISTERITDEDIEYLEELLEQSDNKIKQGILPIEEDYLFHETIAKASQNHLLYRIWKPVVDYGKTVLKESLERTGRPEMSIREHWDILKAMKRRDVKEAEKCMMIHLEKSEFHA